MTIRSEQFTLTRTWVNDTLETAQSVLRFGDSRPPSGATFPYGVMYDLPEGSYGDNDQTPPLVPYLEGFLEFAYQFSIVSDLPVQARVASDHLARALLTRSGPHYQLPAPVGWRVIGVVPDGPSGPIVEGQEPNRVYTFPEVYTIQLSPS